MIEEILNACKMLISQALDIALGVERWATVVTENPLTIKLDGESVTFAVSPDNMAGSVEVGQRVLTVIRKGSMRIYGNPKRAAQHGYTPTNGQSVIAVEAEGAEPSFSMQRIIGAVKWRARFYIANAASSPSLALWLGAADGGTAHGALRVNGQGQITMETLAGSSTANAVRPLPFAMATGEVTITPSAANVLTTSPITFPTGRFTKPPVVMVSGNSVRPDIIRISAANITATGANVYLYRESTVATPIFWFAIQLEV